MMEMAIRFFAVTFILVPGLVVPRVLWAESRSTDFEAFLESDVPYSGDPVPSWLPPQLWKSIIVSYPLTVPSFLDASPGRELYVRLETQPRFDLEEASLSRLQIRPSVGLRVTPSTEVVAGAVGVLDDRSQFVEYRTWQQASHRKKLGGIVIVNRIRLEQRYPGISASEDGRIGHRIRQMIQAQLPLDAEKSWLIILSDEVHFHATGSSFGKAGFDQNRVALRLRHEVSPGVSIEAGPSYHVMGRNSSAPGAIPQHQMFFVVTVNIELPIFRKKKKKG